MCSAIPPSHLQCFLPHSLSFSLLSPCLLFMFLLLMAGVQALTLYILSSCGGRQLQPFNPPAHSSTLFSSPFSLRHPFSYKLYLRCLLALYMFSFNNVVSTSLVFLDCQTLDSGEELVRTQPAVSCTTSAYQALRPLVVLLLIVYCGVVPTVFWYLLRRQHGRAGPAAAAFGQQRQSKALSRGVCVCVCVSLRDMLLCCHASAMWVLMYVCCAIRTSFFSDCS